ncbi:MAG: glycosyltransferase [Euryarchaeota archaeon]|nr:glycosyltransferase [Euryarchaeota archaeon]MBT4982064.1 glycosyltransferase [Euryarchaeota archaeon]MBT5184091.1 glycosyltransferase [Euryarchaeota archaeon]
MTLVSVAVCVRNGLDWIDGCMESLVSQSHSPLEIILVDDGSTDGSTDKVNEWASHELVTAITQDPIGLSAGRMAALESAKGEWFAITDIDVRPEKDWIERMLEAAPSQSGEQVVAVTGRTIFGQADDVISRIRSIEIESKYRSRPRRTKLANGPCSMFKREVLLSLGGFDPSWYHAEDMEVSLKLVQDGGTIVYTPNAVVNHIPETGLRRFLQKRKRDARAHVRIHRRYKGVKHDFIGSSWIVLWMIPLVALGSFGIALYVHNLLNFEKLDLESFYLALTKEVILICILPLFWLSAYLRSNLPKRRLKGIFILITWSIALWQGILLGYLDALLRRNGH